MGTSELLKEIKQLPINKRMQLIEETLKSIRKSNFEKEMSIAAETLAPDYKNDKDLTSFTNLDYEDFYKTR